MKNLEKDFENIITEWLKSGNENVTFVAHQLNEFVKTTDLSDTEPSCDCPFCGEALKGILLSHYKCKKCNEYFTN